MTGLPSCRALTIAQYKRRIFTTNKHAHNTSIAVLKNTMQNEAYMTPIQSLVEKGSTSSDFLSRICSTTYMRKRRQGESSVGKVGGLVHVLHKHASIRAEIYLGMPAASPDCHPERSEGFVALGSELLRCAQHDKAITHWPPHCHPERSEGSIAIGRQMLRCAQHDRAVTHTYGRIHSLMCIIIVAIRWWRMLEAHRYRPDQTIAKPVHQRLLYHRH